MISLRVFAVLATQVQATALVFSLFTSFLYYRSGMFPDFSYAVLYQKTFYSLGFGMIPLANKSTFYKLSLVNIWNVVILIYISGLAYACHAFFRKSSRTARRRK